jgi:hypothetical protein
VTAAVSSGATVESPRGIGGVSAGATKEPQRWVVYAFDLATAPEPITFDGKAMTGFAGDTLASALLAEKNFTSSNQVIEAKRGFANPLTFLARLCIYPVVWLALTDTPQLPHGRRRRHAGRVRRLSPAPP